MPLTAWAQNTVSTITTTENITKTSTVYVGEVVVDGETKIKYLYSDDMSLLYNSILYLLDGINGMADGDYATLLEGHEFDYTIQPVPNGFAICSNPDLVAAMDGNWSSAQYVGTLYYPDKTVISEINSNLYDIDQGFRAALDAQAQERIETIDTPANVEKCFVFHIDSKTTTDVYYTIEDGQVVRHLDATVSYDCEATTVIYTKVELASGSASSVMGDVDGDGTVSVTDVAMIVNHILGVNDDNFIIANADVNGDEEIDVNDVMGTVSIILGDDKPQAHLTCPNNNHPHMIDLGLPSGTKWACCNVGAEKPEEYGGYFAWGETEEKDNYSWGTYIHCDGDENTCNNLYDIAGTQFDVAHLKWGGSWMMPSRYQTDELFNYCTHTWTTINGVYGRLFTGTNNNNIFIPAAGYRADDTLVLNDICGFYWTSSQLQTDMNIAVSFYFDYNYTYSSYINSRNLGLPVRPAQIP